MRCSPNARRAQIVKEQISAATPVNNESAWRRKKTYVSNTKSAMTSFEVASLQQTLCEEKGYSCISTSLESKLGFAITTQGKVPINGLRHPPTEDTNGWYIWCGEELSQRPDFFVPLHTRHLFERCPEAIPFLGLPPGCRFLIVGDFVDVWFDQSLLSV
jgi:hypothetical protein